MNSMEASGAFSEPFVKATTVKSDYARGFADARKRDQELLEWAKNHIAEVEEINRDLRQELNRMKMVATAGIGSLILLCLLWVTVR